MVNRTSQKTITVFSEHFDMEADAQVKAAKKNKKFKVSEFYRWALENKVNEYIEQLREIERK